MLGLALVMSVSMAQLRQEFLIIPRDEAIVADAIRRWGMVAGKRAMEQRVPIVFRVGEKRCVELHLMLGNIGGEPVYCYKRDSDTLTEAFDQVE